MNNTISQKEKIKAQSLEKMFKERGRAACLKSALLILVFFFISMYVLNIPTYIPSYIFSFAFLFLYEAFKPKIFIKLREMLNIPEPE